MDERFPLDSDPRFIRPKKRERVVLDARFSSILDPDFSEQPLYDRYGHKRKSKKRDLKEIESLYVLPKGLLEEASFLKKNKKKVNYEQTTNHEDNKTQIGTSGTSGDIEDQVYESSVEWEDDVSSSDTSSDDTSSTFTSEELDLVDPEPEEEIPRGKMTYRLAAVNLDWDHIRSVDIFAALSSFVPKEGRILSVKVYPSEYGKRRMEKEDLEGPPREIFSKTLQRSNIASEKESSLSINQDHLDNLQVQEEIENHLISSNNKDDSDSNLHSEPGSSDQLDIENSSDSDNDEKIQKELLKEDDGSDFNMTQLRKYQLERLRYYYAIVVCDSINTAKYIYEQCDGREYEASANFFDLRFVPDEESFDSMEVRDECLSLPENYVPDEFVTDALKHSKVKLMWDNDDPVYTQIVKRAFSGKEIDENDFKAYLASTDSEVSDVEVVKKKYRSLLLENEKDLPRLGKDSIVGNMQVTFMPGLDHKVSEVTPAGHETTLEKYMKKEKERKQRKKEKKLSMQKSDSNDVCNNKKNQPDLGFDDPFFSENPSVLSKKKKPKTRIKEEQQDDNKAELELLMMNEEEIMGKDIDHFDMREILKMEKKKNKKKVKSIDPEGLQDNFKIDVNDPRFSAMYSSHHFAIDPTNPRFKKTKSMLKLMEEHQRRTKIT